MAIPATVKYFGRFPTTIVMQSTSQFDGTTPQAAAPAITPGLYTFAPQAGGGLFAFHEDPIEVKQIAYSGGGTLTVTKVVGIPGGTTVMSTVVETITGPAPVNLSNLFLSPGEYLSMSSSGGATPALSITSHLASFAADGAG